MKTLFQGIWNKFSSSTGAGTIYADVKGKLYPYEVPARTTMPYITYSMVSAMHEWQFRRDYERATVQFNIVDASSRNDPTNITNYYDHLTTCFDDATMTVTGYKNIGMTRDISMLNQFPDLLPNKKVWQYSIQYEVFLEKDT